ncbi:hypothetical protein pb186bvf_016413 [Paramecium bursaria]
MKIININTNIIYKQCISYKIHMFRGFNNLTFASTNRLQWFNGAQIGIRAQQEPEQNQDFSYINNNLNILTMLKSFAEQQEVQQYLKSHAINTIRQKTVNLQMEKLLLKKTSAIILIQQKEFLMTIDRENRKRKYNLSFLF